MLKTKFKPLDREQFALLREAKRIVASEFDKEISLQDKDVLDQIYGYALESESDRLYEIFNTMHASLDSDQASQGKDNTVVQGKWDAKNDAETRKDAEKTKEKTKKGAVENNKVQLGDVIEGKECVGFYRGRPMFK